MHYPHILLEDSSHYHNFMQTLYSIAENFILHFYLFDLSKIFWGNFYEMSLWIFEIVKWGSLHLLAFRLLLELSLQGLRFVPGAPALRAGRGLTGRSDSQCLLCAFTVSKPSDAYELRCPLTLIPGLRFPSKHPWPLWGGRPRADTRAVSAAEMWPHA